MNQTLNTGTSIISVAFRIIPHGGPAVAVVVGCILSAVIGAVLAIEGNRNAWLWAAIAFAGTIVVLGTGVGILTNR